MDYSKCVESSVADPLHFVNQDPDPHQSQKPDRDLRQSHQELHADVQNQAIEGHGRSH